MNLTMQDLMGMSMEEIESFLQGRKFIISISGLDNLGKSTQAKLLAEKYPEIFSKPLHINQSPSFPTLKGKDLSKWWFDPNNVEEFVETMYKSLAERKETAMKSDSPIVVMDKGIDFYDERIKATLITLGVPDDRIVELITETKKELGLNNSYEDLRIIILPPKKGERSNLREEEVEENKGNEGIEETYSRYLSINKELLNKKLEESKVFTPVYFEEGKPENMHDSIMAEVVSNIDFKTQRRNVEKVQREAREFFGDNLKMIILGGSAGKGKFMDGWSDIDMYYFFEEMPYDTIEQYTEKLDGYGVHVGATYYTTRDLEELNFDARTAHVMLELNKGKDKVLYNDGISIPVIPIEYAKRLDEGDVPDVLNLLKRELFNKNTNANKDNTRDKAKTDAKKEVMPYNTAKIIKQLSLLSKLLLKSSQEEPFIPDGYLDCFEMFGKVYGDKLKARQKHYIAQNDMKNSIRCKKMYDIIRNIDIIDVINNRQTLENCERMHLYGITVLKMLDEIGFSNGNAEELKCQQREEVAEL